MEQVQTISSSNSTFSNKTIPNHYLVLDIESRYSAEEVGGWQFAEKMEISIAVTYDSTTDTFTSYTQETIFPLFQRLKKADLIIGFNHTTFDYAVLQPFAPYNLQNLPSLDLLKEIKKSLSHRISLDNLAQATLNIKKTANGLQALQWWKEGNLENIIEYCKNDVSITNKLFLFGHSNQYVQFINNDNQCIRIPVDW
ncbi:ribonuclease H-like domain-containing protein [Lawsonia intracellularis]|uniref:Distinct helicase family with a unique C-terminal domain including a metal-binding cysteine cluster n=1 Tax=Lawsonia intracellularis (strain PHE/MN1-00) TaxID=363253 RepID=Q1MPV4_LAWIP|nr:ribonuclease H-like domain-containing protein [Lawsonia intracellularis]AGC50344.1 ribonuclease H-like domain-containing protein [Lawsonia intracellularis N343]KAA0204365.1 helicase [Lawsonia intracellularis]MBZ3892789.1 ribonuclease H-like domain-containing protein [Lawsonia intracellularis]OMQ02813.1 helicase [Lawsonia intracellularis]RBN33050.1 helicase [Lawsonia intracellularis]